MGRKSAVDRLPKKLRAMLIEMLGDPACTQAQIVEAINAEAGRKAVSAGSVCRFSRRHDEFKKDMLRAQSVVDSFVSAHGSDVGNRMGKVINQQIKLAAYDLMLDIRKIREQPDVDAKAITDILLKVSKALKEMEQAEKLNAERAAGIRRDALAEAADAAGRAAQAAGLSAEKSEEIRKKIVGL